MEPQRDGLVQVIELKLVQPVIAIVVSNTIINLTYFIAKKTVQKTCFPVTARLTLLNGKPVTISELHPGDKVQTGNDFISTQAHGF